jgi:hypothetical protein
MNSLQIVCLDGDTSVKKYCPIPKADVIVMSLLLGVAAIRSVVSGQCTVTLRL